MDPESRRRLDHEFRAEMAAWEAQAAAVGTSLRTVIGELAASLSRVAVDFAWGTVTGVVVHAAEDLACIAGARHWDVNLLSVLRVYTGALADGPPSWTAAPSFEARLRELRVGREVVVVRCTDGTDVEGRITEVGTDYMVVDRQSIVPIAQISAVAAADRGR